MVFSAYGAGQQQLGDHGNHTIRLSRVAHGLCDHVVNPTAGAIAGVLGHSSIEVTRRYTLPSAAETAEALEHVTIET